MEINRNQWFLAGMVVLFLGIQFRVVDSFVLTPKVTQFLAERAGNPIAAANQAAQPLVGADKSVTPKTVRPPDELAYAFLSIGAVLILHSFSMKRPE
jgi:hypothetical protein